MDTPVNVIIDQPATGLAAPGSIFPGANVGFSCAGYRTLGFDFGYNGVAINNTIGIEWLDAIGGPAFEIETYIIPATAVMGIYHHLRIPVKGRNCRITVIAPLGGLPISPFRAYLSPKDESLLSEYCVRCSQTVIAPAGNAVLLSGMQTGFIMRVTNAAMVGQILLGPTAATAFLPLNIGEALIYEMKGQITAVNPGGAAVNVNIIETRE